MRVRPRSCAVSSWYSKTKDTSSDYGTDPLPQGSQNEWTIEDRDLEGKEVQPRDFLLCSSRHPIQNPCEVRCTRDALTKRETSSSYPLLPPTLFFILPSPPFTLSSSYIPTKTLCPVTHPKTLPMESPRSLSPVCVHNDSPRLPVEGRSLRDIL